MSLLNIFRNKPKKTSASIAKERLQVVINYERANRDNNDYLPLMQKDIIDVIAKYIPIDRDKIKVDLQRSGENSMLELNVSLPEIKEEKHTDEEAFA